MKHIEKNVLYYDALVLSGGDPLSVDNVSYINDFLYRFKLKFPHIKIWCYTGYIFEDILKDQDLKFELLKKCHILVDGRFEIDKKNINLQYKGSLNQRVIDVQRSLKKNKVIIYL